MDNNVAKDFEHELNYTFSSFPFCKLIRSVKEYKDSLYQEFKELPTQPKYYLFREGRLTNEEEIAWQSRTNGLNNHPGIEAKVSALISEFNKKMVDGTLEKKYHGRLIKSTPLVKILIEIDEHIRAFERQPLRHKSDFSVDYATAFASKIISLLSALKSNALQRDILQYLLSKTDNIQILSNSIINQTTDQNIVAVTEQFRHMKLFADKVFSDELIRISSQKNSSRGKYSDFPIKLNNTQITEIHNICVLEGIFEEDYELSDFLGCFNLEKQIRILPRFKGKPGPKFAYILSRIERMTEPLAEYLFGFKGFYTKRGRAENENVPPVTFTNKVDKIFSIKKGHIINV